LIPYPWTQTATQPKRLQTTRSDCAIKANVQSG
jgi:hypothetical protein